MRKTAKLTPLAINKFTKPGLYGDGNGLYLQVSKFETKSWLFRFLRTDINGGKPRKMGLGPYPTVSLADARKRAQTAKLAILDGIDPVQTRRDEKAARRAASTQAITFKTCAERFLAERGSEWKSKDHRDQWETSLAKYAYPVIGNLSVASISTDDILKVLDPIWKEKTETANRVRNRIELVLNWASGRKYRSGENPARWRGNLDSILSKPSKLKRAKGVKHHAAMPYADVPAFMAELRGVDGVTARALEFTILTAGRAGDTLGAKWSEFDLAEKVWTIPAERMGKTGKPHRVPLSDRAMTILKSLPRERAFVFPGQKAGAPLKDWAMWKLLVGLRKNVTVHGFRSTFRDWASEQTTKFPNHVIEMALSHTVGTETEQAYHRTDLLDLRRQLAATWAAYCGPAIDCEKVVPMKKATRK